MFSDDDDPTTMPHLIVTASVDEIHQVAPMQLETDLVLSGVVTWVGRSSMSIRMEATQLKENGELRSSPSLSVSFSRTPLRNPGCLYVDQFDRRDASYRQTSPSWLATP